MKLRIISDCHLEFGNLNFPEMPDEKNQILILAGDIGIVNKPYTIKFFLEEMSERFKYVLFVLGNHEFYHGSLIRTPEKFKDIIQDMDNIILLNNETFILDGIKFIGSTLWTDLDNLNPILIYRMKDKYNGLNDFKQIRTGSKEAPYLKRIGHMDWYTRFLNSKKFIFSELEKDIGLKHVVISHHGPSYLSVPSEFKGDILNGCYVSNLYDEIYDSNAKLWIHGHTHTSLEYMIGDTRVICNPRGYFGVETNKQFDSELVIEL